MSLVTSNRIKELWAEIKSKIYFKSEQTQDIVDGSVSNATLTLTRRDGTTKALTVNNVSNATNATLATKATSDGNGNNIASSYLLKSGYDINTLLPKTAAAHNSVYRGKDLTSYFNNGGMSAAIAAGTFDDIFPGDYIIKSVTVNGTTYSNVKWIVGDLDYNYGTGYKNPTVHHVLLFPETYLGKAQMNTSNTTSGGYQNCNFFKNTRPLYDTGIVNAFGTDHVLEHSELLSNGMSSSAPAGGAMGWTGSSTWSWGTTDATDGTYPWRHDIKSNIFSHAMLIGHAPFGSAADVGTQAKQIAATRLNSSLWFIDGTWCWCRDVASTAYFPHAGGDGYANSRAASDFGGVRPYFLLR